MNYETEKIIATSLTMAMAFTLAPIAVPNQSKAATATITLSGSTSISPLAQQLAKQYAKKKIKESKLTLPILPVPAREFQMQ